MEFTIMVIKLVFSLIFILILIYVLLKYGGVKMQNIQKGKFIKILEKVPLSKDTSILVVKIGENAYVMSSTSKQIETIKELTLEEIAELEKNREIPQYSNLKEFLQDTYTKIKNKKEDKEDKDE